MKKIFLIILIIFSNPVIGKEGDVLNCSSKVGLGLDLLDNIYSYKDQGIQENFQLKLDPKEINFESGKKVFHKTELFKLLPNYSEIHINRIAKEHLKARNGIFKAQKDSNGKITPATYQLKSLYMVGSDDKNDQN